MESASIIRYSTHHSGHTEYSIKVCHLGKEWSVKKRFSDFTSLNAALKSSNIVVACPLPEKNWWSKFDADFLVNRAKALQTYLDKLILITPLPSLVKEFLDLDRNMLANELKRNTSFKALRKTDRVNSIVNKTKHTFIILNTQERLSLQIRRFYLQRFALMQSPSKPGRYLSSEGPGGKRRNTQSSFSSTVDDTILPVSNLSGTSNGPALVASAKIAIMVDEYRSEVIQGLKTCFSKQNYLLGVTQDELFTSSIPTFPDNFPEIGAILSAPLNKSGQNGLILLDELARIVDNEMKHSVIIDEHIIDLLADNLLFTDPPPINIDRQNSLQSRSISSKNSMQSEGGSTLMIKRTNQDSGSNRPPGGSQRPPPAQEI